MPVIDINGDKKKVACGPCIRGHRSSKCNHSDRVLIEVRKPGRPLSACPHPSGSCGCQRAVFYTVPKNESSPAPSGPLSPAAGLFSPPAPLSSNRVQKPKAARKNSTGVNTSTVQRAFDGDPSVLAQHANQRPDLGTASEFSESSSNVPSLVSSTSSTPQTQAVDTSIQNSTTTVPTLGSSDSSNQASRLQLGMLGVGGYGTTSDEMGWSGAWPDYNSIPRPDDRIADNPAGGSCCGGNKAPPNPKPVTAAGSCCAPKTTQPLVQQAPPADQQFIPGIQQNQFRVPTHGDLNYPGSFSLPGPAFDGRTSNGNVFAEDQFGCLHQPDHSCECGEGCECLGCSMHPANRTTTDYVRYHTELAMRGYLDASRVQILPALGYGQQPSHFSSSATHNPLYVLDRGQDVRSQQFLPHIGQSPYMPQWQHGQPGLATPTFEMSQFSLQQVTPMATPPLTLQQPQPPPPPPLPSQSSTKQQETPRRNHARQQSLHEGNNYDHESPSTEDDASTLSPSAFSVQQFSIPGCNDVTGSCLCGDGCQCEGCLTHNGHENNTAVNGTRDSTESGGELTTYPGADEPKSAGFASGAFDDILRDPIFTPTVSG